MIHMMRRMVLVDMGKTIDQLGAELIITPDKYKRIDMIGTVISIGPKCRIIKREDLGEQVMVPIVHDPEDRFTPEFSESLGLKKHWHFRVFEEHLSLLINA